LQYVSDVSSKPADCTAAGMPSLQPGDYIQVQTTFTYVSLFGGLSVASTFPTPIKARMYFSRVLRRRWNMADQAVQLHVRENLLECGVRDPVRKCSEASCAANSQPIKLDVPVRIGGHVHQWGLEPAHASSALPSHILGHGTDVTSRRQTVRDLNRVTKNLLNAQDDERRRIARDLHDSTAQHLVALGIGVTHLEVLTKRRRTAKYACPPRLQPCQVFRRRATVR
jgi:signal transduction histidine kinase